MNRIYYIIILLVILAVACKHEPEMAIVDDTPGGNPDTLVVNPDPCDPDSVYFTNQVLPLLVSNCAMVECHDAVTMENDIQLDSYAAVMASDIITPGNPGNSDFIDVLTETGNDLMPPTDAGGPLTAEQIALLTQWVSQGAQNNSCTPDCDPAQFSFSVNLAPLIELACEGCHSGNSPSGSLSLETFEQVRAIALDGSLMHSLLGTGGYSVMPDNTLGLPACNITQFELWVNAGAPNN